MKIFLLSLFLLFTLNSYSQYTGNQYFDNARINSQYNQNEAIIFVFQPTDLGIGLRYDKKITQNFGLYSSATWGNYRLENNGILNDHFKFSMGMVKYVPNELDIVATNIFSIALTYHSYGEMNETCPEIPKKAFFPISLDLGTGVKIKRMTVGMLHDFFKREGAFYVGRYF